jgi:hypothetical protein
MKHTRGKPYHPMTQGKIERWHLSSKSRILLENYYLPGDLKRAVADFVEHYNHRRYHESVDNLTPADLLRPQRTYPAATTGDQAKHHRATTPIASGCSHVKIESMSRIISWIRRSMSRNA